MGAGLLVLLAAFALACGGSGGSGESGSSGGPPEPAASADPDPARLREAQLLALKVEGGLRPSEILAQRILGDLAVIRASFAGVADIEFRPFAAPDEILIKLTDEAQERLDGGEFYELDDLNDQYGMIHTSPSFLSWHTLRFDQLYNTQLVAQIYASTPGVAYAEPNYLAGDGSTISASPPLYTFFRRWGDCPSGCIHEESWTFSVTDGEATVLGDARDFDRDEITDPGIRPSFDPRLPAPELQPSVLPEPPRPTISLD
jgi:hypothetical protein